MFSETFVLQGEEDVRVLAISYAMPPALYPRAIQVARTLDHLNRRGWRITVATPAIVGANPDPRLAAWYRDRFQRWEIPLEHRSWRRAAVSAITRRWREEPPHDLLITFAQPWSDHLIGLDLHRRHPTVPWIAHFSDPWIGSPYEAHVHGWRRWRERWRERAVVRNADALVFVTAETVALTMNKYPTPWRDKAAVVPHGFERDFLATLPPPAPSSDRTVLRLVYAGSFYQQRVPQGLFQALAALRQRSGLGIRLELDVVGPINGTVREQARIFGIRDLVHFTDAMDYHSSLSVQAAADVLVLIDAPFAPSVFLPSKLVDYLMLEKPILGLTPPDGAAAALLRRLEHPVVAPDDAAGIEAALLALIERRTAGGGAHPELVAGYDIARTTDRLEAVMLRVLHKPRKDSSACRP